MGGGSIIGLTFEYNGHTYTFGFKPNPLPGGSGVLYDDGPMQPYVVPFWDAEAETLATFRGDDFDEFISIYEIEGKTLEWILEHQREWKYVMDAPHLEGVLGVHCFGFAFVYRKIPCCIYEYVNEGRDVGYYIGITPGVLFDVTPYAPSTPGAEHWTHDFLRITNNSKASITLGPYASMGELLDRIRFGEKTLRELFDTEYDDAATLCGWFGV